MSNVLEALRALTRLRLGVLNTFLCLASVAPAFAQGFPPTYKDLGGGLVISESFLELSPESYIAVATITYPDGHKKDVRVDAHFGDVQLFENRLILLPWDEARTSYVTIVDLETATIVDKVWGRLAVLSPTRRYIAFFPAVPRIIIASALYLLYDLRLSPTENRMGLLPAGNDFCCIGWAIYPDENRVLRHYRTAEYGYQEDTTPPGLRAVWHDSLSSFFWVNDSEVAFVDSSPDGPHLIVVDASQGIRNVRLKTRYIDPVNLSVVKAQVHRITRVADRDGAMVLRISAANAPSGLPTSVDVRVP